MHILASRSDGVIRATELDATGTPTSAVLEMKVADFPAYVRSMEGESTRWVWDDTAGWYPQLLRAGIRVGRCHDLRLSHVILCNSAFTADSDLAASAPHSWDGESSAAAPLIPVGETLFDFVAAPDAGAGRDDHGEYQRQLRAVAASAQRGKLRLLLAAESAGALIAAEMQFAGLPWRTDVHEALLAAELGPRVPYGTRPARLEELAGRIRILLDDAALNPDSQADLLRALRGAGLPVRSTRAWELKEHEHPALLPLMEYKKLSRLLTANGWYWMDTWIANGRFRPDYLPGGVVTGRWAARGGGALQLPKQVRDAVRADEGWKLVVADASQLEPRILAALSTDMAMADAGRGTDLYAGIVASGVVETREHAKVAMLGAMYGATTGESGRLLPKLARAYPRALELTEAAARAGERGGVVTTRLGRSSPRPSEEWFETQASAYSPDASRADENAARRQARDWGRFTRNFVVQGSAAEWALCWMAEVRKALRALEVPRASAGASPFHAAPHLVFFLHDEVMVHAPAELAPAVERIIIDAAAAAGRLLFGDFPVDFLLTVATVDSYADAK